MQAERPPSDAGDLGGLQVIFCSRMVRCVQTAYEIAKRFDVPIVVCKGLLQTEDICVH
jgi:broad specificity phosphatase PhoE